MPAWLYGQAGMVDRSLQIEIMAAAKRARERDKSRKRRSRLAKARHRRKPPVATLELLGSQPSAEWLASVARSQAKLRTAMASCSGALSALQAVGAAVARREVRLCQSAIGDARRLLQAAMPTSVCPVCLTADPACQACSGLGCLTLAQASQLSHELLHDR